MSRTGKRVLQKQGIGKNNGQRRKKVQKGNVKSESHEKKKNENLVIQFQTSQQQNRFSKGDPN